MTGYSVVLSYAAESMRLPALADNQKALKLAHFLRELYPNALVEIAHEGIRTVVTGVTHHV